MEAIKTTVDELVNGKIKNLKAGDSLLLSGVIYTARDAAHKRMCEGYEAGKGFPFDINGSCIYCLG